VSNSARWHVRPSMPSDCEVVAEGMKEADRLEIWASNRSTPFDALRKGLERSAVCWTGVWRGRPMGMCGCISMGLVGRVGSPWMLTTDEITQAALPFWRENRRYLSGLMERYDLLFNYVDARHATSIRWLRRLGFSIGPAEPFGVDGLPFHRFEMRGEAVWDRC